MPPGGATPIGTFGALSAAFELAEQIEAGARAAAARGSCSRSAARARPPGCSPGFALAHAIGAWRWPLPIVHGVRVTPWPVTSRVAIARARARARSRGSRRSAGRGRDRAARAARAPRRRRRASSAAATAAIDDRARAAIALACRAPRLDGVYSAKAAAALLRLHRARHRAAGVLGDASRSCGCRPRPRDRAARRASARSCAGSATSLFGRGRTRDAALSAPRRRARRRAMYAWHFGERAVGRASRDRSRRGLLLLDRERDVARAPAQSSALHGWSTRRGRGVARAPGAAGVARLRCARPARAVTGRCGRLGLGELALRAIRADGGAARARRRRRRAASRELVDGGRGDLRRASGRPRRSAAGSPRRSASDAVEILGLGASPRTTMPAALRLAFLSAVGRGVRRVGAPRCGARLGVAPSWRSDRRSPAARQPARDRLLASSPSRWPRSRAVGEPDDVARAGHRAARAGPAGVSTVAPVGAAAVVHRGGRLRVLCVREAGAVPRHQRRQRRARRRASRPRPSRGAP